MPGLSGIELQRALDSSPTTRPIIFLTGMGDIETSVTAMKAGAIDFLTKPIESDKLLATIELALKRDAELRQEREMRNMIEERLTNLTPREREVMVHIIRGRLNKQIAADLGAGEKTIKKLHRHASCEKCARTAQR